MGNQLYNLMGNIHDSIQTVCEMYAARMKRYVYVTPKSYLCFIEEYIKIYVKKKAEDIKARNKILEVAMREVDLIKKNVQEQEQSLAIEVEKVKKIDEEVSAEAEICNKNADEIGAEATKVQGELDEAKPKLIDAKLKMSKIDKNAITNLSGGGVAMSIRYYWDCVCLILSKRVAPIEDFGDLVFTQKQKKPEDKTTVLSYNMSFEYVKKYNASGQIINIIL